MAFAMETDDAEAPAKARLTCWHSADQRSLEEGGICSGKRVPLAHALKWA